MGIDGEASADLADPFENMRAGLYAVRDKYEDATVISPYQVFWLHTMGSADALGMKSKLGSLEPGKFGDFLVINPARLGAVIEDPYANLVLVTSERDVDRVYVGGQPYGRPRRGLAPRYDRDREGSKPARVSYSSMTIRDDSRDPFRVALKT
jgi:cytosine/adenosine deaminase-related metal-dependent hydrolase